MTLVNLCLDAAGQPTSPDAFAPALIGLFGVALGGAIQTGFAWRKARNDEARVVREGVTRFRRETGLYLALVSKLGTMSTRGELQQEPPEVVTERSVEVSRRFRSVSDAGYALAASPDYRIAKKARQIMSGVEKFAQGHEGLFIGPPRSWPGQDTLPEELEELLDMVVPAKREYLHRFRGEDQVRKR